MVYKFHCRGVSLPLLSLCLGIFEVTLSGIFNVLLYCFSLYLLLVYRKDTEFVSCYLVETVYVV
jgi:hypothetical protein